MPWICVLPPVYRIQSEYFDKKKIFFFDKQKKNEKKKFTNNPYQNKKNSNSTTDLPITMHIGRSVVEFEIVDFW